MGQRYPWGNTANGSNANFSGSGDIFEGQTPATTPVGYYNGSQLPAGVDMANGYGLYDMAGNVWEWCWDWYGSTYYGDVTAINNPRGPMTGTARMLLGGGWANGGTNLLPCAFRFNNPPSLNQIDYGFRCARGL